ncbi:hypothetical protein HAX54_040864 [Datura stramonium]|uniref:Uncharacterized protein n=1 Tax=Datura stramonium TaxID=4076 RepID=A0ABS8SKZ2_DATST|nr:hypothetical protein [Datura stramonium]
MTALLKVLPEEDWDAHCLLNLCERAQLHQVFGLIHAITYQYLSALDSYLKAVDEPILAFVFVDDMLRQLRGKESDSFRSAVISQIPDLLKLNRLQYNSTKEGTFLLIVNHFGEESDYILSQLQSNPESLFCYLKTLIEVHLTGTLNFSTLRKNTASAFPCGRKKKHLSYKVYLETLSDLPKILQNYPIHITDEMTELYIQASIVLNWKEITAINRRSDIFISCPYLESNLFASGVTGKLSLIFRYPAKFFLAPNSATTASIQSDILLEFRPKLAYMLPNSNISCHRDWKGAPAIFFPIFESD